MKLMLIILSFFILAGCEKEKGIVEKGNLTWMRCSLGQEWDGDECLGKAEDFSWNQHFSAIKQNTGYEGYTDWRLPTSRELNSLVICSNGRKGFQENGSGGGCKGSTFDTPTIDNDSFPNTPLGEYFTSEKNKYGYGGTIDFKTGIDTGEFKGGFNYIRLVRE